MADFDFSAASQGATMPLTPEQKAADDAKKRQYMSATDKLNALNPINWLIPEKADTANLTAAMNRAFGTQDRLAAERAGYTGAYSQHFDQGMRGGQARNIADLFAASHGNVPSPAEIQLQRQAGLNAARQFGLAAALQGRNPGAALRQARIGSVQTQAGANIDAAMLRAMEQERARQALVQALASARTSEQGLRGQDIDWQRALLSGEINALDAGGKAAGAEFQANNTNAATDNQFKSQGLQILGTLFSDERLKTDVKPASLVKLADATRGFTFRYKDPEHGEGERVGVMAQDVAKGGPIGRGMVKMDGVGRLKLDVGNAVGAALAMSAEALREAKRSMVSLRKAA